MLVKGHLLDPCQAADYGAMITWRRLLLRRPDLHAWFQDVWNQGNRGRGWRVGPVQRLRSIVKRLGWDWHAPFVVVTADNNEFNIL